MKLVLGGPVKQWLMQQLPIMAWGYQSTSPSEGLAIGDGGEWSFSSIMFPNKFVIEGSNDHFS
jgi:hypothetical protein